MVCPLYSFVHQYGNIFCYASSALLFDMSTSDLKGCGLWLGLYIRTAELDYCMEKWQREAEYLGRFFFKVTNSSCMCLSFQQHQILAV